MYTPQAVDALLQRLLGRLGHGGNVAAGTKCPACAGNHDGADIGIGAPGAQNVDGARKQLGVKSIELVRTVQCKRGDAVLDLGDDHGKLVNHSREFCASLRVTVLE